MSDAKKKSIIIAGDDGALYHLSEDDLQAHKMDPDHPAHASIQKLVGDQASGVISRDTLAESTTINYDINVRFANLSKMTSES